jgi:ornithine carbamoyltransferase
MRDLISLTDIDATTLAALVNRGVDLARGSRLDPVLADRAVGMYFAKPSTRTRTSFWRAATRLGAEVIAFGPADLQVSTGETLRDTGRMLSRYLDLLVVRTNGPIEELRELASAGPIGVVNALTEYEHPTQAVADIITLREEFTDLSGRQLLYLGEGNSTAAALAYATALTAGLRLTLLTPKAYRLPDRTLDQAACLGCGDRVQQCHDLAEVDGQIDAVYTSRWQTMGVRKADPEWTREFTDYRVSRELFDRIRQPHTVFLHDLPAVRGEEVVDEVLDGAESRAWRQALHKMTAAMAILEWCADV